MDEVKMITINLNKDLITFEEQEKKEKLSQILATRMGFSSKGDPLKMFNWALQLWKTGEIVVDKVDLDKLIEFVEQDTTLINLVKAQLLTELKAAK